MSKREKIILVIMALTVVYGFYALFLENPAPLKGGLASAGGNKLDAFNKFITSVAALTKEGLSDEDAYIIERIPDKWTKDPLLNTGRDLAFEPDKVKKDETAEKLGISYTGFLKMGNRSLAIINGQEYEQGEKLPDSGHVVERIDPNRVVLGLRGGQKTITVPLEETQ